MKFKRPSHLEGNPPPSDPLGPDDVVEGDGWAERIVANRIDANEFYTLLADVATNAWKAQMRLAKWPDNEAAADRKRLERNVEAILGSLGAFGVNVKDHTGDAYDYGQPLKVAAAQTEVGIVQEIVAETIRPTVFYKGRLIQRGEVIIATPAESTEGNV